MALTATPSRRRLAMIALLVLAALGGLVRTYAPNPSTLRDIGTLLLVLWLPAVGNLIAYLLKKVPRSAPPATSFAVGSTFTPHLDVNLQVMEMPKGLLAALDPDERQCTVLVGRSGFTARVREPLPQLLAAPGPRALALEVLHPAVALGRLKPGTDFHLLAGTTAVAKGTVVR